MIETTIPEISVTELMARVKAEASKARPLRLSTPPSGNRSAPSLPPVAMLPAAPTVWIPGGVSSRKERLDALLQTARRKIEVSSKIPKFLRRFFRKQGGYNQTVLEGIAALSKTNHELSRRVTDISACLGQLNGWLLALHEQSDADANWMKAAAPILTKISARENELGQLKGDLEAARTSLVQRVTLLETDLRAEADRAGKESRELRDELARFQDALKDTTARTARNTAAQKELLAQLEQAGVHPRNLEARENKESLQKQIEQAAVHLTDLQDQSDRLGVHINNLQAFVDKHSGLERKIAEIEERNTNEAAFVKGELSEYGSLFRRLLGSDLEGVLPPPRNGATSKTVEAKTTPSLDAFYFSFENRFRGPRHEIKKRIAFYLPFLRKARAGAKARPVLDLGCGRGEWLEILKEHKLVGEGVDLNSAMISQCKERRLKVRHADALEYLRSLRASSHGAITGFHIIEHLPFEVLMDVFRETRRVLKPGGVAIFESPNCKNLVVGACNFHIDPTHRHPVFPETAEFMLASHGFEKIRIEYLSPVSDVKFAADTREMAILKDLLYGPQDFGIIAYKPKAR